MLPDFKEQSVPIMPMVTQMIRTDLAQGLEAGLAKAVIQRAVTTE